MSTKNVELITVELEQQYFGRNSAVLGPRKKRLYTISLLYIAYLLVVVPCLAETLRKMAHCRLT